MGWTTKTPENGWNGWRNVLKMQSKKRSQVDNAVSGFSSQDQDPSNGEFATAVLAAAFAIHSLEEAKTPQNKNEKRTVLKPSTNQVTRRPSYNKTKIAGETSMRKSTVQDHEGIRSLYSGSKPSQSSAVRPTPAADAWQKVERHEKLKSVLAWANEKKKKAKQKIERTKSESELKIAKKRASTLSK